MDTYLAQIEWLSPIQGGRKTLPLGNMYYPIIVTEGNVLDTQKDCWSVVISDMQLIDTLKTIVKIQYFAEKAPNNLFPGVKFMLYEGPKLVATGIILKSIESNKQDTMVYKESINHGIKLDSFSLLIEWNIKLRDFLKQTKDFVCSATEVDKFAYCAYRIVSKLFDSEKEFIITFNFRKNKLSSVNISDNEKKELTIKYNEINAFLESRFGKPNKTKFQSKTGEIKSVWKIKNIKIKHSIINTINTCQILEIIN